VAALGEQPDGPPYDALVGERRALDLRPATSPRSRHGARQRPLRILIDQP